MRKDLNRLEISDRGTSIDGVQIRGITYTEIYMTPTTDHVLIEFDARVYYDKKEMKAICRRESAFRYGIEKLRVSICRLRRALSRFPV